MKILSLLILLSIGSLGLSAQDTATAKPQSIPGTSRVKLSGDVRIGDTVYVNGYARPIKPVTEKMILRSRNASIVMTILDAGIISGGVGVFVTGTRLRDSNNTNAPYILGGATLIGGGFVVALGTLTSWIIYGDRLHRFKTQKKDMQPYR